MAVVMSAMASVAVPVAAAVVSAGEVDTNASVGVTVVAAGIGATYHDPAVNRATIIGAGDAAVFPVEAGAAGIIGDPGAAATGFGGGGGENGKSEEGGESEG
jgi:hypothetical protein